MKEMSEDFKKFIKRGNLVDMAVGIVIGVAFGAISRSLVDDIIMPPLGLVTGGVDFAEMFWVLQMGDPAGPYATVEAAKAAGAVTLNYGSFVNTLINFIIVALAMFVVVKVYTRLTEREDEEAAEETAAEPVDKECPFCFEDIPIKAVRCPRCTSDLEGSA